MAELLTKASYEKGMNEREKRNLVIAYEAACESIVLLENDGALPIQDKRIAMYGAGVTHTIKGGTGSGEVNERHSVTIYEGMKNAGFVITTENWLEQFQKSYEAGAEAFQKARWKVLLKNPMGILADYPGYDGGLISDEDIRKSNTDTCVYVVSRQAGEGVDRRAEKGDYFLTENERANIEKCASAYKKFILVINGGSQIDMAFADEIQGINAILFICQLGTAGGKAVADVLSGKRYPSGKLSDTWAKRYKDIPFSDEFSYLNNNLEDEFYKEGIFVGYRYFDTFKVEPRYPFGYGLAYTDFEIQTKKVSLDGSKVTVKALVSNVGENFAGKEVVEVYVSSPSITMQKEYQSLAAFKKSKEIGPKQSEMMEVSFDLTNLASYRESDASYILEAGKYIIRIGNSSRNTTVAAVLLLEEKVVVSRHENICPQVKEVEELSRTIAAAEEDLTGIEVITVDPSAFETVTYTYETPEICQDEKVQAYLNTFTREEMVEMVVGIGMFGGETRFTMPGSVGNTTSKFWDRGLVNVTLCDGPAGIRIQKRTALLKNGKLKAVDPAFSFFNALPGFAKKAMLANPEKEKILYQYTTAFPVACALAQTWNTELLYKVGKAVHDEMKEYGCTYWLAPAMNIHRNPLCGRNFEYFSEDPFLTGAAASAIIKGVQCEDGFYVTIKHFACNNQEDNRKNVSSNLSERALREIYLRGFEMAVREGNAKAVMTSYNKVNNVYTPNSYDLCTKALRNEWGFDGVVMTDWFSTSKGSGDTALCMKAGNDLIMPGGKGFQKEILKGIETGVITDEELKRCCGNVIKLVLESNLQKEYMNHEKVD